MTRLESLIHIKEAALFLLRSIFSEDAAESLSAQTEISHLVDRFYEENEDIVAFQQCEVAKNDVEYLLVLVELAIVHAKCNVGKDQGE